MTIREIRDRIEEIGYEVILCSRNSAKRSQLINERRELTVQLDQLKKARSVARMIAEGGVTKVTTNDTRTPEQRRADLEELNRRKHERGVKQLQELGNVVGEFPLKFTY